MKYLSPALSLLLIYSCSVNPVFSRFNYGNSYSVVAPKNWIMTQEEGISRISNLNGKEFIMAVLFNNPKGDFEDFKNTLLFQSIDTSWEAMSEEITLPNNNLSYRIFKNNYIDKDTSLVLYRLISASYRNNSYLNLRVVMPESYYLVDSLKYIDILKSIIIY